jgi:hypothetical protein
VKKYILLILLVMGFWAFYKNQKVAITPIPVTPPTPTVVQSPAVLGVQTKTAGCQIQGPMPDKDCTPGAVFSGVTKEQVCVPGYSQTVRNVPESEKNAVYNEYGILSHQTGEYEVDHDISLELGGSNEIANLWPEAANPTPGFHEKDKVENYLHQQVCQGAITLQQAQQEIANDWLAVYEEMVK